MLNLPMHKVITANAVGLRVIIPFLAAAAGGAAGATLRYAAYRLVGTDFPWATFAVNIIGCCLASFLMFRYGADMHDTLKTLVFTGLFGAFTTMSTFSIDTVNLLASGSYWLAAGNVILNSVVCVAGAVLGRYIALLRRKSYLSITIVINLEL